MCGFAGIWQTKNLTTDELTRLVKNMALAITHRGPDDSGEWVDASAGFAVGFRRLSILDTSPTGHQPMLSATGRYVIAFNGEIYNFLDLKDELLQKGHEFRGTSDTEVILTAVEEWGVDSIVPRLNGMFAIALWDRKENELVLARDHIGIKPIYYGWNGGQLYFASELKSLRASTHFIPNVNRNAVAMLLRYSFIPSPHSIYEGIYKLEPGHLLKIKTPKEVDCTPVPYWSLRSIAEHGCRNPHMLSAKDAQYELEKLLLDSVRRQMVADVPLGAFLSGGIDSSLVVSLMQAQSTQPIRTFSMGFSENDFDEAPYAKRIAQHLGTDHTEMYVTPREAMDVIPQLPQMYDEPFADSSQIPTYLVSKIARRDVVVSLSGDGGDELFGGYPQYWQVERLWKWIENIPRPLRPTLSDAFHIINPVLQCIPAKPAQRISRVLLYLSAGFQATSNRDFYGIHRAYWRDAEDVVIGAKHTGSAFTDPSGWPALPTFAEHMMYVDTMCGLTDDMLVKVDRASMAASLEARVPLLDHRIIEFAWKLPLGLKVQGYSGKWILKEILCRYIPQNFIDRPKQGFAVPIAKWLRGPMRAWAEDLLNEARLKEEGFLDVERVRSEWRSLLYGSRTHEAKVWSILMFESWLNRWMRQVLLT
jgi:asparagine synthase (glutamine-hydrolysing)